MDTLKHFFWQRQPAVDAALLKHFADFVGPGKLVVDVGAGYDPWPYATEFVDREAWPQLAGKPVRTLDVELDRLPYADKQVDFLYCRHTIEDLHNPTHLLREMNRVAKAGYLETPSPIAELCRGAGGTDHRGFAHHHWIVWRDGASLRYLPKYPIVESPGISAECDRSLIDSLNSDPLLWFTYYPWVGTLNCEQLRHRGQFSISTPGSYEAVLQQSFSATIASTHETATQLGLIGVPFEYARAP